MQRLKLTRTERERFRRIRRLEQVYALDPIAFERYCGYLYSKSGYKVFTTATSGDQGVDLFLRKGLRTVVVQCKRYKGTVGQPTVRDMYGTMGHNNASGAVVVTTGRFSRAAEKFAADKPIQLVDGHELMSWRRKIGNSAPRKGHSGWGRQQLVRNSAVGLGLLSLVLAIVYGVIQFSSATGEANLMATVEAAEWRAPRLADDAVVDGVLREWGEAAEVPLTHYEYLGQGDAMPISAQPVVRFGWTETGLRIAAAVEDDDRVGADSFVNGDYLSVLLEGMSTGTEYEAILVVGDAAFPSELLTRIDGVDSSAQDFPLAVRASNSGYFLEAEIPWSWLEVDDPVNQVYRLQVAFHDGDGSNGTNYRLMLLESFDARSTLSVTR